MNSPQRYLNVCIHRRGKMFPSGKEKSHLISYQSQNSENFVFSHRKKEKIQEQTQGGSPVRTLLRTNGRPGQSRTSHQTDGINM